MQIELVQSRPAKTPFPPSQGVALAIHRAALTAQPTGVLVYPGTGAADDGSHDRRGAGDQILICPPYGVTKEEIQLIVDVVGRAIGSVLGGS